MSRLGTKHINKQGDIFTVVEYTTNKSVVVEFEDGSRVKTTWMYIKGGKPLHPTKYKIKVGDTFECKDGDTVTVEKIVSVDKFLIKWKSDGAEDIRTGTSLKTSGNKHPTKNRPSVGSVWPTNNGNTVTVTKFNSATSVEVEFEDGNKNTVSVSSLQKGVVGHPMSGLHIGMLFTTNSGWSGKVTSYTDPFNVGVEWQDGSSSSEVASYIHNGSIKPKMQPSVEGIGYFGVGRFSPVSSKTGVHVPEKIRGYWKRMFSRVYNPFELNKDQNARYRDCFIDEHFHSLQNFAEWVLDTSDVWMLDGMELDKDLLGTGKLYSPNFCTILPASVNKFLLEQDCGNTMRGVNIILPKPGTNASVGYIARCSVEGDRKYLGFYPTEKQAFLAYKEFKEKTAIVLAEKYKEFLTPAAYDKLKNYVVTPLSSYQRDVESSNGEYSIEVITFEDWEQCHKNV